MHSMFCSKKRQAKEQASQTTSDLQNMARLWKLAAGGAVAGLVDLLLLCVCCGVFKYNEQFIDRVAHYLLYRLKRRLQSGLYIAFFHILFLPTIFCYIRCVVNDAGEAIKYKLLPPNDSQDHDEHVEDDRKVKHVSSNRFCGICQQPKPERCHHCSECNTYCLIVFFGFNSWQL